MRQRIRSEASNGALPIVPRKSIRKPPRNAAISIRLVDKSKSYAEILQKARNKISSTGLGIESSRVRKAANDGILFEIPDADGKDKADVLVGSLRRVLGEGAMIT